MINQKRNNINSSKIVAVNRHRSRIVRFEPKWITMSTINENENKNKNKSKSKINSKGRTRTRTRTRIKRKKLDEFSSVYYSLLWYTHKEMKDNYKSIIKAAKIYERRHHVVELVEEEDIQILNWFSSHKRIQRKIQRKQMYDTLKAIQEYEKSTCIKVPDLLSKLLQRHSQFANSNFVYSFQNN
jgi:succinate dehydrogenase flavin-adding protein (antitoxin of CptAB toxin-antitoxin module)